MFDLFSRDKLTTLLFHKVPVVRHPLTPSELSLDDFTKVLHSAAKRFRILPLEDALISLRAGNLPPNAACITFDDGYPDWRDGVVPILEREGVHATFFLTSGQFTGTPMWNERILHAVASAPADARALQWDEAGLPPLYFGDKTERQQTIRVLDGFLKYQQPVEKERLLAALESHVGIGRAQVPTMCAADLRHLHSRGFGIGGHSVTHPILSRCSPVQAYEEIAGAREQLEGLIGGKVTAFAYPNGTPGKDFGAEHIEMVKRAGYHHALTTQYGTASSATSPFQIPRFTPWGPTARRMGLQFTRNLMRRSDILEETGSSAKGKRVLMVAFHFPPQAGSSGILRTLNFVKYLPRHGWNVSVLSASPRAYVEQRNDLVTSIPSDTIVLRAGALDAARHLSIRGKYLRASALPDRWSSWWIPAVWAGMREVRRTKPALIWSTYPIATAHLIGGTLARMTGLPWVADFRDPMLTNNHPAAPLQRRIAQWVESRVLRDAQACIFTTHNAASSYQTKYPESASKCHVIENGYDDDVFELIESGPKPVHSADGRFLLLHSGLIYPAERDPSTFFAAVRSLIDRQEIDIHDLCIRFRAPGHGDEVLACAERYELVSVVEIAPPIPYRDAIAEMISADLLLVFQGPSFNTQVPAKIYEYARTARPILAIADPFGETVGQLKQFIGVWQADISSVESVMDAMRSWLKVGSSVEAQGALEGNVEIVRRYSRRATTEQLNKLFQELDVF